jgi:hypothetical protein
VNVERAEWVSDVAMLKKDVAMLHPKVDKISGGLFGMMRETVGAWTNVLKTYETSTSETTGNQPAIVPQITDAIEGIEANLQQLDTAEASTANSYELPDPAVGFYSYTQDRNLLTIPAIWKEYDEGLKGHPPVRVLEERYNVAWRKMEKDSKHFIRRRYIYDEVERLAAQYGETGTEAAKRLEAVRASKKLTVTKLWQCLKDSTLYLN